MRNGKQPFKMGPEAHRRMALALLHIARRTGNVTAFFDGCCEPVNPGGTAGWGAVIYDGGGAEIWQHSGFLPPCRTTSNNIAEYLAVTAVFDRIREIGLTKPVAVFGDSRLVICQLWGWPAGARRWKINGIDTPGMPKGHYADVAASARAKLALLPNVRGHWIPRDQNGRADDLSKAHLRRLGVQFRIQPEEQGDEHAEQHS